MMPPLAEMRSIMNAGSVAYLLVPSLVSFLGQPIWGIPGLRLAPAPSATAREPS